MKTQHTLWLSFVNWPIRKCFSCPAQILFWIYGILSGISIPTCKKKNLCEGAAGTHWSLRMYERKSEESSVQLVLRDRTPSLPASTSSAMPPHQPIGVFYALPSHTASLSFRRHTLATEWLSRLAIVLWVCFQPAACKVLPSHDGLSYVYRADSE